MTTNSNSVKLEVKIRSMLTCACQFSLTPCSDEEDDEGFSCASSISTFLAYEHWPYPFSYLRQRKIVSRRVNNNRTGCIHVPEKMLSKRPIRTITHVTTLAPSHCVLAAASAGMNCHRFPDN